MRMLWIAMLVLSNCVLLSAQMFEQVYPNFEYAQLQDGTQWSGDTFYLCGDNQMLLCSTDAGKTWTNDMTGRRDWCFYDIARDGEALYLLAEPTVFWSGSIPERQLATLLSYDPRTTSLDLVEIPRLSAPSDEDPTSIHDLMSAGGEIFLLQGNNKEGLLLHRSNDGGQSWTEIPLPDSLNGGYSTMVCLDSTHIALVAKKSGSTRGALATTDGGQTWAFGPAYSLIEKNGLLWLSESELIAYVREGPIMYSADAGQHWEERSYPPTSAFFDAGAVDGNRGYILGGFGQVFRTDDGFRTFVDIGHDAAGQYLILGGADTLIIAGRQNDNIYVSHDGGISWNFIRKSENLFWDLRMVSDTVGVALVENIWDDTYRYYRTLDGWKSRTMVLDQTHPMFPQHYVGCRMYPVTEMLWYIVHPILPEHRWLVHRSTDAGESWENILSADELGNIPMSGGITVVGIPDTNYFGIILEQNLITTSDRGHNWQVTALPGLSNVKYSVQLRPITSSWLIGWASGDQRDTLWRCTSGWDQWEAVLVEPDTVGNSSVFRKIQITLAGEVLLLADFDSPLGYMYDWSYIFRSSNDGRNWELYPTSHYLSGYWSMEDGNQLYFDVKREASSSRTRSTVLYRSTDGWKHHTIEEVFYSVTAGQIATAGEAVYVSDRYSIWRNLTNGVNSVQTPLQAPSGLTLQTPYPHPIRRSSTVTLPLQLNGVGQGLRVTLHNLLGRKLRTLYDAPAEKENPDISWNTNDLVPGIYILRVEYDDIVTVKPVVVE